ncbi:MAG TPA: sigma-70 family RNA polymerase sigma factor [Ilumatobacteraceae bacterium]|nr:sigma-70 family RNA polymerase sigma factor [Ilumatobacteraceae bacterium]
MRRVQEGDATAFEELLDAHRTSAFRVATVVLGSAHGADEVVQDASIRAWRSVASVDADRGFRSWYLRVVANTARNDRRSRGRRAALVLRLAAQPGRDMPDPEEHAVTHDDRRRVIEAMNHLGRDDRLVIALRHFEQLSEKEMADVLGCAAGTVKSRLSRAMSRLRAQLVHDEGGER